VWQHTYAMERSGMVCRPSATTNDSSATLLATIHRREAVSEVSIPGSRQSSLSARCSAPPVEENGSGRSLPTSESGRPRCPGHTWTPAALSHGLRSLAAEMPTSEVAQLLLLARADFAVSNLARQIPPNDTKESDELAISAPKPDDRDVRRAI